MLSSRDWDALYRRQLTYALIAVPAALFNALQKLASTQAALAMRTNLQRALNTRYAEAPHLPLALAQAEGGAEAGVQMGTADVSEYCQGAVSLFEALFKPSVEVSLP